jgi:O-antigen/teichoic acid export membrane protein
MKTDCSRKEIVMKPDRVKRVKSVTEKIVTGMVVTLVVMCAIAFMSFNHISEGGEFMSKLFLVFVAAIIAMPAVPGLFLLGAMLKGIASLGDKEKVVEGLDEDKESRK